MPMEEICMRKWPNWTGILRHSCMAELSINMPDTTFALMMKVKSQIMSMQREEWLPGKVLLC